MHTYKLLEFLDLPSIPLGLEKTDSQPWIANVKNDEPFDVFIGRPSKWGNPYVVGVHGVRGQCVELYREYLLNGAGRHLLDDLHQLKGKKLGCFCKPRKCHGDILAELANKE